MVKPNWYEGKFEFNGKKHTAAVINGVRYIDSKSIEEFMDTLSFEELIMFFDKGLKHLKQELHGKKVRQPEKVN